MKKKEDISDAEKKLWEEYLEDPKDLFDKELEHKFFSLHLEFLLFFSLTDNFRQKPV